MGGVFEFIFAEEGQTDFDKMGIEFSIESEEPEARRLAEEEGEAGGPKTPLTVTLTWLAQEGKGDDLEAKFQDILDTTVETFGEHAPPQLKEIKVKADADKVRITFMVPPPPEDKAEQEAEEMDGAFEGVKPQFTASLWTGRTFPEMFAASGD